MTKKNLKMKGTGKNKNADNRKKGSCKMTQIFSPERIQNTHPPQKKTC